MESSLMARDGHQGMDFHETRVPGNIAGFISTAVQIKLHQLGGLLPQKYLLSPFVLVAGSVKSRCLQDCLPLEVPEEDPSFPFFL
jgi:hypothetical protein